jgi:predicted amidohydrolase YtcJ
MRARILTACALALCAGLGGAACGGGPEHRAGDRRPARPADLVLRGGVVVTMDPARPRAAALAVRGGRVVRVGADAEVTALVGPETHVVELAGAAVVPGLTDAHAHLMGLGLAARRVDLVGTTSYREVVRRVGEAARAREPGAWVLGRGWDQNDWRETGLPRHAELSDELPDRPVCLTRIDGHAVLVNGRALELAGIGADTPDPAGGEIIRDEGGQPTGVLVDNAIDLVARLIPPAGREERAAALIEGARLCAEAGLTGVHDAGVSPADAALIVELAAAGKLPLRVYVMLAGSPGRLEPWFAQGPRTGLGGGLVDVRAVKLMGDGALGSRGAWLLGDYADRPGHRGAAVTSPAALERAARAAHAAGFQVCTHAIGDAANRAALDVYERVLGPRAPAARWRIEHAQVIHPRDIVRFARLGVIASMQPTHATSDMPWAGERLGRGRLVGAYAWRKLLDAGAALAFGSDFPVESHDPRLGLYAAVTRQDARGEPKGGWLPGERLQAEEALRAFTVGAAHAAFREHELGRIAPGYLADLTVFDRDPTAVEPHALPRLRVLRRFLAGRER